MVSSVVPNSIAISFTDHPAFRSAPTFPQSMVTAISSACGSFLGRPARRAFFFLRRVRQIRQYTHTGKQVPEVYQLLLFVLQVYRPDGFFLLDPFYGFPQCNFSQHLFHLSFQPVPKPCQQVRLIFMAYSFKNYLHDAVFAWFCQRRFVFISTGVAPPLLQCYFFSVHSCSPAFNLPQISHT